jgi:dTDP-glucose 4,6-dehydratase
VHVADRPGHDVRYALDTSKIQSLGWKSRVALDAGLAETVSWYQSHGDWAAAASEKFDRTGRLGTGGL